LTNHTIALIENERNGKKLYLCPFLVLLVRIILIDTMHCYSALNKGNH